MIFEAQLRKTAFDSRLAQARVFLEGSAEGPRVVIPYRHWPYHSGQLMKMALAGGGVGLVEGPSCQERLGLYFTPLKVLTVVYPAFSGWDSFRAEIFLANG